MADQVGTPPLLWAVNRALIQGKYEELERLFADAGKEMPPEMAEIVAEAAAAASEPEPDSLEEFVAASRYLTRTPAFLMRLAIPALVRFGEDLESVVDHYWQREGYDSAALKAGVADAIGEFADRLSPERLRALIERGITHSLAETRKTFYMLSVDYLWR